jgi:hypothetical protein
MCTATFVHGISICEENNEVTMSKTEKHDKPCIRDLISFLNAIGRPVAGVDDWLDEKEHGEIDAIAGPYAIEHTSVDSLPNGRLADVRFKQVIGALEDELAGKLGFPLAITWDWAAIQIGPKWIAVGQALRSWIVNEATRLADGRHHMTGVTGVPFAFDATKGGPIKFDGVRFARYDPGDCTFATRLSDQLAGRHKKLAKLGRHKADGKTTALLLESRDVALMNPVKMIEGIEAAFPARPPELDEVWFLHYTAPGTVNVHDLRSGLIWLFDRDSAKITLHNPYGARLAWTT